MEVEICFRSQKPERSTMAKSRAAPNNEGEKPQVAPEIGIRLLERQIEEAEAMVKNRPVASQAYYSWRDATKTYLDKSFGKNVKHLGSMGGRVTPYDMSEREREHIREKEHFESLSNDIQKLEGYIGQLNTEIEIQDVTPVQATGLRKEIREKEVFIVHGRNEEVKTKVARFLELAGLHPIILHEQAARGRTLIEKFIDHSAVGYAVVLLTADDLGKIKEDDTLVPRARQNVVFEMGYFYGLLGRENVSVLADTGVEILSDLSGIEYLPLSQHGVWHFKLLRELKAAGFPVEMEKALSLI
jgi:predicted nucleotide-binding protein